MIRNAIADMAAWPSLSIEGNLIAPAMIAKIDQRNAPEQNPEDYGVRKGIAIREEVATAFRVGQSHFDAFSKLDGPSQGATRRFISGFFRETFGFEDLRESEGHVSLIASDRVPMVIVPPDESLDKRSPTLSTDRSRSPTFSLQDFLNDSEESLWGFATNGMSLRLMRDNPSLTRPAHIDADLQQMFTTDDIASFATLWHLTHRSRFGTSGAPATDCALERWRDAGAREGEAARDRLAGQVEVALRTLGSGFLEANPAMAAELRSGEANLKEWFNELLRLIYRLIFLMVAEDRNLLHPETSKPYARDLYVQGYSLGALRNQCIRRATWDNHRDRYEGLKVVFRSLVRGESNLALPALGGLFAEDQLPILESARLSNRHFMDALYRLSWLNNKNGLVRVNWRTMETEELGSVYETLLELQPQIADDGKTLKFASDTAERKGNQRKTTGSYYTPISLVENLLDSALEPVLEQTEAKADDPADALLNLTVIDPSCGSGHFLLAAARRIALRLARSRVGGAPSMADFRHAVRDVARCCIYGVDKNSLAVELTKVALWIETLTPGLPLGFFDAQIRCGDALLGVFDLCALQDGIPNSAYKPLKGDDRDIANIYKKINNSAIIGQGRFDFSTGSSKLPEIGPIALDFSNFRALPEETMEQLGIKSKHFKKLKMEEGIVRAEVACDLYVSAYLTPKIGGAPTGISDRKVPTTEEIRLFLNEGKMYSSIADTRNYSRLANAFHWPLEFPDIMEKGGFDAVIGNPPWKKISHELNDIIRQKSIGEFARSSGRFPLSAVGELNLYPLFTELSISLKKKSGWSGLVLKSHLFTGSTWEKFTDQLITSGELHAVYDFNNRELIFPSVGSNESFSLATIGPKRPNSKIRLAVALTNPAQLDDSKLLVDVDRMFPRRVNPETGTLPQCGSSKDVRILSRIAGRFNTLGKSDWKARYSRGIDLTIDKSILHNREWLESQGYELNGNWFTRSAGSDESIDDMTPETNYEFAPIYEGKFIQQYDHRFGTYDEVPARRRFGSRVPTIKPSEEQKTKREFEIIPRYWVKRKLFEENTHVRQINSHWNIAFRDTTDLTNFRTAVGCIVGPAVYNNTCPNIVVKNGGAKDSALFLSMFNSVPYDYLTRQKFYGAHFTKSMLMQTFVVDPEVILRYEKQLLDAVAALTNLSLSVRQFCSELERPDLCANDPKERVELRAWIDAIYFILFGFDIDEVDYIFDTFDIWKEQSNEFWGRFYEKERTISIYSELEGKLKK